jgi:aminopeptidase
MNDDDYAGFVTRALFLDQPDPVAAWRALSARQAQLVKRLRPVHEIHIEAPGTDLRLRVDGRTWINSDGKHNMPSGEVFTGPIEDSAQGTIHYTIPSSPRGVEVRDVRLRFDSGRVVEATAETGQAYLDAALATDDGARFLGEIGIGTNTGIDRATGSILFDEKMAGTVHLALGRSYPETGGTNVSAVHWDMICDLREGGRLSIDGQVLNENGSFVG